MSATPRGRAFRVAATGARVLTGAAVAAACVLGVSAAVAAPWPVIEHEPPATTVQPVPGDAILVCNGSFRALGRDTTRADAMLSAGVPALTVDRSEAEPAERPLQQPDLEGGEGASSLTGAVTDRTAPMIAAAESLRVDAPDMRGFAAAPCREPSTGTWLIGGDVSTGAADVIVLSNPGDVATTVQLRVYGERPNASDVVVPPSTQIGVPLASVAAAEPQPVIAVTSRSPIRASLQSSLIRTLDPIGIDVQDGMSGPQNHVVITGVQAAQGAGDDPTGLVVRMLAPEQDGHATVRARPVGGATSQGDAFEVDLRSGIPTEVALSGLAPGVYDIEVEGTAPVVAAARQTLRAGTAADFAWMPAAPEIAAETMVAVPDGESAALTLRNRGAEDAVVTLRDTGRGSDAEVTVPAGGSTSVPLRTDAGYLLVPSAPVHAAVTMTGGADSPDIAGWPVWAPALSQQPIAVRP
ncbi:DUF5719 family protein [Microbacterium sp. EF45047]|uniref:DUF5719 family protein n=1 Tax=Microbacterium sp. EF45047 TaxID=2809708 RepID=UPI00234922BC|nr:DUF5719 family protein [Microbacterium sp. EF45047]WCM56370.1 hypothetical protein JRG78_03995 [Microbacterium sp. EF45047]